MEDHDGLKARILAEAAGQGFSLAGVAAAAPPLTIDYYQKWVDAGMGAGMSWMAAQAHLRAELDSILSGAKSVIAVAMNYHQPNPIEAGQPHIAQYALGRDYHRVLRRRLKAIQRLIEDEGHRARICVDSAPLLEREWAQRAGIGWPGKNTMLINSRKGSFFLLAFILTDAELEPDQSAEGGCGTCQACIEACPTGAIRIFQDRWAVDSRLCISYWTIEHDGDIPAQLAEKFGPWTFGCDICQEVCPFNQPRDSQPKRANPTKEPDFLAKRKWPSLEQLAQISHDEWSKLTEGSPVRRAGYDGLKRNARISLRNEKRPGQ